MGLIALIIATTCVCCLCMGCCRNMEKGNNRRPGAESRSDDSTPHTRPTMGRDTMEMQATTYNDLPPSYEEVLRSSRIDLVEVCIECEDDRNAGSGEDELEVGEPSASIVVENCSVVPEPEDCGRHPSPSVSSKSSSSSRNKCCDAISQSV